MRILMVSKFRNFLGGVESHIDDLSGALIDRGHDVRLFTTESMGGGGASFDAKPGSVSELVKSTGVLLWNSRAKNALQGNVDGFKPDIIHFHSVYHQLSPSVLAVRSNAGRLMTLHDYKLATPCYTLYRGSEVCTECVGSTFPVAAVRYRCVKGSVAGSSLCAIESVVHRPLYRSSIDRFIVPSRYAAKIFEDSGIPSDQLSVIPWGVSLQHGPQGRFERSGELVVLFAGRLHPSKGIEILLDAWASRPSEMRARLIIAGDGECRDRVLASCDGDESISYLGLIPRRDLMDRIRCADLCVVPSLFPETLGLSALESLMMGTPVLASKRGALADLEGDGVILVDDMSVSGLGRALVSVMSSKSRLAEMRRGISARDLSQYRSSAMTDKIEGLYSDMAGAVGVSRGRNAAGR